MKLEIKLSNDKYCDGCPLKIDGGIEVATRCGLNLKVLKTTSKGTFQWDLRTTRPEWCIQEHGL